MGGETDRVEEGHVEPARRHVRHHQHLPVRAAVLAVYIRVCRHISRIYTYVPPCQPYICAATSVTTSACPYSPPY